MEIKLLTPGYKKDESFYRAFQEGKLWESEYISDQSVWIPDQIPDFPIYFPSKKGENHNAEFLTAIEAIDNTILHLDRDYYMDELFWHSVLCLYKRDYLISLYPSIAESYKDFTNMVVKPFDWENYIYKAILIAQYVADERPFEKMKYYKIIFDNMDMFNYIIKYEIFRNSTFLINVMDIITDNHLESQLKAKIKNRSDLGEDERYGRRVILELNRSYPIIMSPMLSEKELEKYFLRFLSYYAEDQTPIVQLENVDIEKTESAAVEEEPMGNEEELFENNMLFLYEQWLRKNNFFEKVIDQYKEKIEEVSIWYRKNFSGEFYEIRDTQEIKKINDELRNKRNSAKYRIAIKYYIQFMDDQKGASSLGQKLKESDLKQF